MSPNAARAITLAEGEGESLSQERHYLIKAALPELSVLESGYPRGESVSPHVHERHADCFYVLEGVLDFTVADESTALPAGSFVAAAPGVVHSFSVASEDGARWLNLHAPDAGFVESRRARRDGRPPRLAFDVSEPPPGGGRPADEAIIRLPGEGERIVRGSRLLHVKAALPQLTVVELEGELAGPSRRSDDRIDCFYVLDGEVELTMAGRVFGASAGAFVAAPRGVELAFRAGRARLLQIRVPGPGGR